MADRASLAAWPRGLVCTVRPEGATTDGDRRRATYVARKKVSDASEADYEALFLRVTALARARQTELRVGGRPFIGAQLVARGWDVFPLHTGALAFASLTLDFVDGADGLEAARAENSRSGFDRAYPSELARFQHYVQRRFDELYVDFDFRGTSAASDWVVSYGEYVALPPASLEPFVERARRRAAFYADALEPTHALMPRRLLARDCTLLEHIGKKAGPDNLVDVLLSFGDGGTQAPPNESG